MSRAVHLESRLLLSSAKPRQATVNMIGQRTADGNRQFATTSCHRNRNINGSQAARNAVVARIAQPTRAVEVSPPTPRAPTSIHEIDNGRILGFGENLAEDHPGFHDEHYKRRRVRIAQAAKLHRIGDCIADVEYLPEELATWGTALKQLQGLVPKYGCTKFVQAFHDMNFRPDSVPQLQGIHEQLQAATGWNIRPVAGLMHPREFLNGLAFKTFHSTQYMRHHSNPVYTPEPDVVHELLGHVPMLLNQEFCSLVEAIGRASLGASEKTIWHLTKAYWYTVEFGVVQEGDTVKAFGAGILSSYGELEWMGSGRADILPFNPWQRLPKMSYKDGYQRKYFCLESFHDGAKLLQDFSRHVQAHGGAWVPD